MLSAVSSLKWTDWAYPTKQISPNVFFSPKENCSNFWNEIFFTHVWKNRVPGRTRIVGVLQSVNGRKDENPTRKTCSEYFKAYKWQKWKRLRRGFTWKTSVRIMFCLLETLNGNQNNWICDMSTRGFLIEILLHIYNVQQTK